MYTLNIENDLLYYTLHVNIRHYGYADGIFVISNISVLFSQKKQTSIHQFFNIVMKIKKNPINSSRTFLKKSITHIQFTLL